MAEKKKILYIVEAMGGGVFTYIVDLANELVDTYDMYIAYAVRKQTPSNYKDYFDKRIHMIEVKNFARAINAIMFTPKPQEYTDPLTGEMKKKQMKFFPDTYKNRIGKSYNDYIADRAKITLRQYQRLESGERSILTCSFGLACRVIEALDMDVSKFYHGDYYLEELKTIESK